MALRTLLASAVMAAALITPTMAQQSEEPSVAYQIFERCTAKYDPADDEHLLCQKKQYGAWRSLEIMKASPELSETSRALLYEVQNHPDYATNYVEQWVVFNIVVWDYGWGSDFWLDVNRDGLDQLTRKMEELGIEMPD